MVQKFRQFDNLGEINKKFELFLFGRLRKENSIDKAVSVQDELSKKSGSWNGADEIRKWREKK